MSDQNLMEPGFTGFRVMTESMTGFDVAAVVIVTVFFAGIFWLLFVAMPRWEAKEQARWLAIVEEIGEARQEADVVAAHHPSPTSTTPVDAKVTFSLTTDTGKPIWSKPPPVAATPSPVDHPPHYNAGGIECIDAIEAALTPEEFRGFCKGSALKYAWRERHKGGNVDVNKADWFLARLAKASGNTK